LSAGLEGYRVVRAGPVLGKIRRVVEDARGHGVSHFNLDPEAGKENRNETNRTEPNPEIEIPMSLTSLKDTSKYVYFTFFVLPSPKCEQTSVIQAALLCHASHVADSEA